MRIHIWKNMPEKHQKTLMMFAEKNGEPIIREAKDIPSLVELNESIPLAEAHDFWSFDEEPTQGMWYRWRAYKDAEWRIMFH